MAGRRTTAETRFVLEPGAYPFEGILTDIGLARLHHIAVGHRGPRLLMLHGNPTWSILYRDIIIRLSNAYRCVAVDLPGFGLSEAPPGFRFRPQDHAELIVAWLRANDIRDATLVAHDWGGPIGLAAMLATRDEGRITGLCLGNTWAWPVNRDWHFRWFSWAMGGPIGRWGSRRYKMFVNVMLPTTMRRRRIGPGEMHSYRAPFDDGRPRTPLHVFPAQITRASAWLGVLARDLAKFDGPVAFVWPESDVAFRDKELKRWIRMFPRARVRRIPRCGHFLWIDAPVDCVEAIRDLVPPADAEAAHNPAPTP
jgi:haloalkane dehalogenase